MLRPPPFPRHRRALTSRGGQSGARGSGESAENAATEAAEGDRVIADIKRIGREVDRTFRGEYEAREDEAGAPRAEEGTGG